MIVLDTHSLIWWATDSPRLSRRALRAVEESGVVGIPDACCLEIALLAERTRIHLSRPVQEWLEQIVALANVDLLPITPAVAHASMGVLRALGGGDPFDAVIAATALVHGAPLVTNDARLTSLRVIETIW